MATEGGLDGATGAAPGMAGEQQPGLDIGTGSSQGMVFQSQKQGEASQVTEGEDVKITYSKIGEGDEKKYKCDACEKVCEKEQFIKTHITKMHTKKKESEKRKIEDDHLDENEKREKRMFDMYGDGTISQAPPLDVILNYGNNIQVAKNVVEETVKSGDEVMEHDDTASLKAENEALKVATNNLRIEMETKHELLEAKTGRCDTLEEEKIVYMAKYDHLHGVAGKMFNDMEEMRKAGGNAKTVELKKKIKKVNEDLKNTERNLEEFIRQCGIEASKRASAEAELARNAGLVDLMTRTVSMLTSQMASGGLGGAGGSATGMAGQQQSGMVGGAGPAQGMAGHSQQQWAMGMQGNQTFGGRGGPVAAAPVEQGGQQNFNESLRAHGSTGRRIS